MRSTLLSLVLACGWFGAAATSRAEEAGVHASTEKVKTEITAVIEGQLAAFRAGDYAKAYGFAAAEIQGMFPQAEFEKMVKSGYPVIARSVGAEFGLAFDTDEQAVVNVVVQGAHGKATFQYHLKKEDGKWKIGGVEELKQEPSLTV